MELSKEEKLAVKFVIEKELEVVKKEGETFRPNPAFLALEEKYEILLEKVLKKL